MVTELPYHRIPKPNFNIPNHTESNWHCNGINFLEPHTKITVSKLLNTKPYYAMPPIAKASADTSQITIKI